PPVGDGDVRLEPLAREHGQHTAAAHDDVRGLVSAGDGKAAGETVHVGEANTLLAVDVLTPRTLDEALRLKSERPDALPIQGGTGVKRNVLADDELILAVDVDAEPGRQTFLKVGPRNAMVISVVSLALRVDGELTASFGSAGPVPGLVSAPLEDAESFPVQVAA